MCCLLELQVDETDSRPASTPPETDQPAATTNRSNAATCNVAETATTGGDAGAFTTMAAGLSADAHTIIMANWRYKTKAHHKTYIRKWREYCAVENLDPLECSDANLINFLTSLCKLNRSYSKITTAKSAVLSLWEMQYQERHSSRLISWFVKRVEQSAPPLVRSLEFGIQQLFCVIFNSWVAMRSSRCEH